MIQLPIDPYVPQIVDAARQSRAVVVTAEPGAGKTTRVPPALLAEGAIILLQPRRVAARAIAQRIAAERRWTIGREIGWQIRFERRFGFDTRLLVATEGILTARFQEDPLLSSFNTIVLDEFHERSIHADLGLALAKQAWRARADLRIVVMSATLDAQAVSTYLDDCPIVSVPGRTHPLAIDYEPGQTVGKAAADLLERTPGDVLCFLPGAFEIRRAIGEAQSIVGSEVDLVPLYGALDSAEQDRALRESPPGRRRVVVTTNIAETSVTVPGVTAVVDSGLHKVARYDADRSIDSLTSERITQDSADQRAGRAGRLAPGVVRRLWDARDRLRPHREAEIQRVDLSSLALDVIGWGGDPRTLEWFDRPHPEAIEAALMLLERLGAVRAGTLTHVGRQMQRLPIHPRLARMLIAAKGARSIARACALVSERQFFAPRTASTTSDLLSAVDDWAAAPAHVHRVAREIEQIASASLDRRVQEDPPFPRELDVESGFSRLDVGSGFGRIESGLSESDFLRAVLAGYPDRVGQRREAGSPRVKLASGAGAVIGPQSGVREGEFLVAIDLFKARRPTPATDALFTARGGPTPTRLARAPALARAAGAPPIGSRVSRTAGRRTNSEGESLIRVASRVEREWLTPNTIEVVHRFDEEAGVVRAAEIERYDALTLTERPVAPDAHIAAGLLAEKWLADGPRDEDARLLARLKFAGQGMDLRAAIRTAAHGVRSVGDVRLERALSAESLRALERDAPGTLKVPSGRSARLEYGDDGTVTAAVKLQELFGLAETPRIGPRREPILFALLAPNGRPVQMTRDLKSFWKHTYPAVRKELRGRYPKHPWPEDPWKATPTARTTRRRI